MNGIKPPVFPESFFVSLPRPDRWYRRLELRQRQPSLSAEQVGRVLAGYGLGVQGTITMVPGALRSTNAVVETDAGRKLLKRYRDTVEQAAIVHEHSILRYLAQVGFPAPRLSTTSNGDTVVAEDGERYALFEYLEGYFQYHNRIFVPPQTRKLVVSAGKALACFHQALKHFVPAGCNPNGFRSLEEDRWRGLNWYMERLDRCRTETDREDSDHSSLLTGQLRWHASWIGDALRDLDARLQMAELPRVIVHGDYGPYNLLFKRGAAVVVVDLELSRLDWRLTDLATALEKFARNRAGFDFGKVRCFLEAYRSVFPMTPGEMDLLPQVWQFWILRHIITWWHRYSTDGEVHWLVKAERALDLIRWLMANERVVAESLVQVA
jgi:Ser/Thr protein kinase RdoA (MazF antagonist)